MELLDGMSIDCGEGNISWFPERQELLVKLIKNSKPKVLVETGFNMGHSALLICKTIIETKNLDEKYNNEPVDFYIFDICEHECVRPNFEVLKNNFKDKINLYLIEGSSFDTIKIFNTLNSQLIDFAEIDGCHTYEGVQNDVTGFWDKISNGGTIYIDDYKSSKISLSGVDSGVNDLNWSKFTTNFIDGVFWAERKNHYKMVKRTKIIEEIYY